MDLMLMLRGDARWCADCAAETIFVPVPDPAAGSGSSAEAWCCTVCDAAVVLAPCSAAQSAPWAA